MSFLKIGEAISVPVDAIQSPEVVMSDPEILKRLDLVSFNGNLGDFALSSDGVEIVEVGVSKPVKKNGRKTTKSR